MSISQRIAGDATSAFDWLSGYEQIDLRGALGQWPHLPYARESGRYAQCAELYLGELDALNGPGGGPLVLGGVQVADGTWLAGLRALRWDSDFFGFEIGALYPLVSPEAVEIKDSSISAGSDLVGACVSLARASGIKQLSASTDSSDTLSQLALEGNGFRLRDSLVFFELKLENLAEPEPDPSVHVLMQSEVEAIAAISAECFGNRIHNINRFNSDPQFPRQRVHDLYAESIRNSYLKKIADQVLVLEHEGVPVGFITMSLPGDAERKLGINRGKILLNAIHPEYQGRGFYTRLVRAALRWFRAEKLSLVEISTQLPNIAVHRTWQKLGAPLVRCCHRFHLNLEAT